jgi:hypothetical protein
MLKKSIAILSLVFCASVVSVQAADQSSESSSVLTGVVLERGEGQVTLWTGEGKEVLTFNSDTLMPRRSLAAGNLIWAETDGPGSNEARRIILVDEEISVVGRLGREHAVIGDSWEATSPSQLVVRSNSGQELFVVSPETFHQPLPKKGERVAVIYRVEEVKPPRYIATGLVTLPAGLERSPVKVSYSPIPQPETQVAEVAKPTPAPEAAVTTETEPVPAPLLPRREAEIAELPHTARQTPLIVGLALLLMLVGWSLRSSFAHAR